MENATDALYMGFAMIVFVVALSLSIFSFSKVTDASQRIVDARDKTTQYNYYKSTGETSRIVTREDIIPTLYRAYYENYIVKFENITEILGLYAIKNSENNEFEPTFLIDLGNQTIGSHEDADNLITHLLQGDLDDFVRDNERFNSFFQGLPNVRFYDILEGKNFKEEIGLFPIEDSGDTLREGVDEVNKNKKRIITYTYLN